MDAMQWLDAIFIFARFVRRQTHCTTVRLYIDRYPIEPFCTESVRDLIEPLVQFIGLNFWKPLAITSLTISTLNRDSDLLSVVRGFNLEMEGSVAARRVKKADREKLRRDRLNEQFNELGNVLDPDRPKNDKGAILTDTIQLLNDLNGQVDKLKAEYVTLSEESRELMQEKNDLREEKTSLKSDIENLNNQYQMRLRASFPWGAMDHSVVMAPYPYPVPMTMPIHPSMHPYPCFPNQNSGAIPNSFSAFMPRVTPNTVVEHGSTQHVPPSMHLATSSHVSNKQDCNHTLTKDSGNERSEDSNNVVTDLELKTPGSKSDQGSISVHRKPKTAPRKDNIVAEESSPSTCSSRSEHSSSNSVCGGTKPDTDATTHVPTS